MKRLLVLAAGVAALCQPALADYTVKGSVECPAIVEEDANEHYREYNKWWMLGYITGRNFALAQVGLDGEGGKDIEVDVIYAEALAFCKANPDSDWDDAALDLYERLLIEREAARAAASGGGSQGLPAPSGSGSDSLQQN